MNDALVMALGLVLLAVASGMLGLGVAFAAVPFLGLFLQDLVHEVQPLSLLLNGVTALFALLGFARSRLVAWKPAIELAVVTTIVAPAGAYAAHLVKPGYLWALYLVAVVYVAYRMLAPGQPSRRPAGEIRPASPPANGNGGNLKGALLLAAPISLIAAMLGVGPGFLLLPTLILFGFEPKRAAAMNALAVTPPSFSALVPHLSTARVDPGLAALLVVVGAVGSFVGARLTSLYVPGRLLKQLFGVLIVVMTAWKLYLLVR